MTAKHDPTDDVEVGIDGLYQGTLDRFTANRNALASELRKARRGEDADRVKALPKPSVTAWAVNQAWWRDREAFQAMLDAGEALRSAHLARLQGQSADVRAAAEARQEAVNAVVDAAVRALGGPDDVSPDARHRIAGTIEALASSGVPADATIGRLSKDLQASGLEALSALTGLAPAPPPRAPAPKPVIVARTPEKPKPSTREAREEAKAEAAARERAQKIADAKASLAEREAGLRAAKADASETASAEKKSRAALDTATTRVADLEAELEQAREHEREARRALAQATKAASEAEMIHARAVRDVNAARERLQELQREKG
jgi:hypothetical protein